MSGRAAGSDAARAPSRTRSFSVVNSEVAPAARACDAEPLEIAGGESIVVGECGAGGELHAGALQTVEKLIRPRDPAEGSDGTAKRSNVHDTPHAPDLRLPAVRFDLSFHIRSFVRRNRNHMRPLRRMQCLAQIACGQQMIVQIAAGQQQNVHIAGELAVLKSIVK